MESPRKFNDCYFYYYSTCTKGDSCIFRHEPSALGCETMCAAWQQGKCMDKCCKLRHMELRKNRKQIACYWETQPGGCRKKHCPFMHKNPDARTDGIAPSQPTPVVSANPLNSMPEALEPGMPMGAGVPVSAVPPPAPAPVPLLWQQQRQQGPPLVLDSAILGVLPGGEQLLPRRVVAHHEPAPYASLPVDPLVVNFEEESDNESAPSSTPTKTASTDEAQKIARTKSQELFLLEQIQAEAAAFYSYDSLPPAEPVANERKIVRTNLATKYDRLSLDEIAGKKQSETRNSLDFKVLSLDEIRARKKISEAVIHTTPITLNLNRKRKLSTHESLTTSGNKIIKVVRSNSIVYKKLDQNAPAQPSQTKVETKRPEDADSRKRTLSELSDIYDMQEDELVDNCYEFKRIKIVEQIPKPRLVRNRSATKSISESKDEEAEFCSKNDDDSDTEVQFVGMEIREVSTDISTTDITIDDEVIDVDSAKMGEPVDIVDLCEDKDDSEITATDLDLDKNVPDVVASCQKNLNRNECVGTNVLNDIDAYLNEEL
ncbi:zinc finger CCCH domain-containing protein 11C-like [Maniola hyperantus]|uniref:zinc finger CCCH domain-containing protein 11C-like n=1 Tax=Aphantopus hyperantus TaxID=2795564 RepID=UPI00156A6110|nr:zinc finger CCCH domain-containing protein 11B-like [Maniola hyperantus]